jgi:hypothetical protein
MRGSIGMDGLGTARKGGVGRGAAATERVGTKWLRSHRIGPAAFDRCGLVRNGWVRNGLVRMGSAATDWDGRASNGGDGWVPLGTVRNRAAGSIGMALRVSHWNGVEWFASNGPDRKGADGNDSQWRGNERRHRKGGVGIGRAQNGRARTGSAAADWKVQGRIGRARNGGIGSSRSRKSRHDMDRNGSSRIGAELNGSAWRDRAWNGSSGLQGMGVDLSGREGHGVQRAGTTRTARRVGGVSGCPRG